MVSRIKSTEPVVLGVGVLNWPARERRGDRYGLIGLNSKSGGYDGENSIEDAKKYKALPPEQDPVYGKHGKLVAMVLETRQSGHIGDLFHGVFPVTPEVGQEIALGEGTLFHEESEGFDGLVGLRPDDGRNTLWLDINSLYRCHDQTVELRFIEE